MSKKKQLKKQQISKLQYYLRHNFFLLDISLANGIINKVLKYISSFK